MYRADCPLWDRWLGRAAQFEALAEMTPLSREEYDALMTAIADNAYGCARQRAGLEMERRHLALRAACRDSSGLVRWEGVDAKLRELDQVDRLLGQLRVEIARLHQRWTPAVQARRDALAELEKRYGPLQDRCQRWPNELKTHVRPPAAMLQQAESDDIEQRDLRAALVALSGDRGKFPEEPNLRERLGSSPLAHLLCGAQRPSAGWQWQPLVDVARGVTPGSATSEPTGSLVGVPTGGKRRNG